MAHLLIGRSEWRERVGRRNPLRVGHTLGINFGLDPKRAAHGQQNRPMLGKRLADVDRNASSVPQCQLQLMVIQMTHGSPKFVQSCGVVVGGLMYLSEMRLPSVRIAASKALPAAARASGSLAV